MESRDERVGGVWCFPSDTITVFHITYTIHRHVHTQVQSHELSNTSACSSSLAFAESQSEFTESVRLNTEALSFWEETGGRAEEPPSKHNRPSVRLPRWTALLHLSTNVILSIEIFTIAWPLSMSHSNMAAADCFHLLFSQLIDCLIYERTRWLWKLLSTVSQNPKRLEGKQQTLFMLLKMTETVWLNVSYTFYCFYIYIYKCVVGLISGS